MQLHPPPSPPQSIILLLPPSSVLQLLVVRIVRRLPRVFEADFPRLRLCRHRDFATNSLHLFGRRIEIDLAFHAFRYGGTLAATAEENRGSISSSASFDLRRRVSGNGSPGRLLFRREDRGGRRVDDVGGEDDSISTIGIFFDAETKD